jgi:hypothetical protein
VTDLLLNKEALQALAESPNFKTFGFLAPVRYRPRSTRNKGCTGCPQIARADYMTDTIQEVVLQSLVPGGAYNSEVSALKQQLGVDVLVLPSQRGLLRI